MAQPGCYAHFYIHWETIQSTKTQDHVVYKVVGKFICFFILKSSVCLEQKSMVLMFLANLRLLCIFLIVIQRDVFNFQIKQAQSLEKCLIFWASDVILYSCSSNTFPLLCTWCCLLWCMINICQFVPGTCFSLSCALKGADGVLRWRRAENSCSPARMKQWDREVQIKIILPTDPSADSRVLLYCYHGDWNRKEVKLLQSSAGSAEPQAETQTSD